MISAEHIVLGHAGEEMLYVAIPVAIIMLLIMLTSKRNEHDERDEGDDET